MRSIVRLSLRALLRVCPLLVALAALAPVGCGSSSSEPEAAPGGSRFGAGYEILTGQTEAAPEEPPALRGDTLTATVAYPGGEETHDFTLGHATRGDTARLWLRHDAGGDEDSTRILDEVRLPVPPKVLEDASTVVLLNPQGGTPFVLRWPGE
jgi:hypothetical protein